MRGVFVGCSWPWVRLPAWATELFAFCPVFPVCLLLFFFTSKNDDGVQFLLFLTPIQLSRRPLGLSRQPSQVFTISSLTNNWGTINDHTDGGDPRTALERETATSDGSTSWMLGLIETRSKSWDHPSKFLNQRATFEAIDLWEHIHRHGLNGLGTPATVLFITKMNLKQTKDDVRPRLWWHQTSTKLHLDNARE